MVCHTTIDGLLYPAESETRQIRSLDGLWEFRLDEYEVGEKKTMIWHMIFIFVKEHFVGYFDFKLLIIKLVFE